MRQPTIAGSSLYVTGGYIDNPNHLFGRDDILRRLRAEISGAARPFSIRLHGQRRMGKTSITQVARTMFSDIALPVYFYVNSEHTDPPIFLDGFKQTVLRAYEEQFGALPPTLSPYSLIDRISPADFRERFIRAVAEAIDGRCLLLMLDEFETLARAEMAEVRSRVLPMLTEMLLTAKGMHLGLIVIIGQANIDLSQEFYPLWRQILDLKVSFMKHQDAERALIVPSQDKMAFAPSAIERVYDLTHGHPFFINGFGQVLAERFLDTGRLIDGQDVEDALPDVIDRLQAAITPQLSDMPVLERQMQYEIMLRARETPDRRVRVDDLRRDFGGTKLTSQATMQIIQGLERREIIGKLRDERGIEWVRFLVEPMRLWVENFGKPPQIDELRAELRKLQQLDPPDEPPRPLLPNVEPYVANLIAEARAAAAAGSRDNAIQLYVTITQIDEFIPDVWLELARLFDDPNDKRQCLENVLMIDPSNAEALRQLGRASSAPLSKDATPASLLETVEFPNPFELPPTAPSAAISPPPRAEAPATPDELWGSDDFAPQMDDTLFPARSETNMREANVRPEPPRSIPQTAPLSAPAAPVLPRTSSVMKRRTSTMRRARRWQDRLSPRLTSAERAALLVGAPLLALLVPLALIVVLQAPPSEALLAFAVGALLPILLVSALLFKHDPAALSDEVVLDQRLLIDEQALRIDTADRTPIAAHGSATNRRTLVMALQALLPLAGAVILQLPEDAALPLALGGSLIGALWLTYMALPLRGAARRWLIFDVLALMAVYIVLTASVLNQRPANAAPLLTPLMQLVAFAISAVILAITHSGAPQRAARFRRRATQAADRERLRRMRSMGGRL
jgi:hypothetical protein